MLSAVAFVPSPPLLVPELMGAASDEMSELRDAALAEVRDLAARCDVLLALGTDTQAGMLRSVVATYVGYGADVVVRTAPDASGPPDPDLPLAAATVGWLRDRAAPANAIDVMLVPVDADADACASAARDVADRVGGADRVGLLVVADGATTLTAGAPGAFDDRAEGVQQRVDDALDAVDTATLRSLDPALCAELGVSGRAAWQVAATVVEATGRRFTGRTRYRAAPYGVGYTVGSWT
ncbi:hypothetical protein [Rhodococcoides corynebacterioides]|uniref:hypothetical protein n=1 Tax=Rhodococcoides corynebacterioides TaxID=53972 RepID=UPI001C9A36D7|nr:hypothetical protein [Rhodococcus corynebacterioides]